MRNTLNELLQNTFSEITKLSCFEYHYSQLSHYAEKESNLSWVLENYGILYSKSGFFQMCWKNEDFELHYQAKTTLQENGLHLTEGIIAHHQNGRNLIPDINCQYEGQLQIINKDDEKTYKQQTLSNIKDSEKWNDLVIQVLNLLSKKNHIYQFTTKINRKDENDNIDLKNLIDETLKINPSEDFWLKMIAFIEDYDKMESFIKCLVYDNGINIFSNKYKNILEMLENFFISKGYSQSDWEKRKVKIKELIAISQSKEHLEEMLNKTSPLLKKTKVNKI